MALSANIIKGRPEAGCDEAGRGCLAGPVVAAAVILPDDFDCPLLTDSKQMSEKNRYKIRPYIIEHAIDSAIGICSPEEIDEFNILNASILAMHKAINGLRKQKPEFLLIDGNRFKPYTKTPHECFVKGDGRYLSIAAASVLAKTYRDDLMTQYDRQFPDYQWKKNKGYPTKAHRDAIAKYGISPLHRKSFRLAPQLKLDFDL